MLAFRIRGAGFLRGINWALVGLSVNYGVARTLSFLCSADKKMNVESNTNNSKQYYVWKY